ncbi:tRNA (adenosine(37)-N6)-dimethylallyltransferase MiaA [Borrelia sp. CA_690]|uniref:tRNA dimethylallyltransferase n=1 Tax=Borrelia maritima TaxID=2761123 RepID=A0A5J6WDQ7_9SPIR|nr:MULTISPECIES: tRNA (adenosine(37)-N6)-dimethylallyltransferase MiaA [Borrelia]QFI14907.1 tRNA (adenosine(37)-N6)-dimethylallyltransferase MiaA [Borrelia maritima]WKC84763.1 tRNA (adenosine(37)-N6)-dimethylallyltransferase MiaA [Borrelia sp. CA_690]
MKADRIVFIFGPTAVGKSNILFHFPKNKAEVINVDSIQVYKEFNVASSKPSKSLMKHIKHHLVDFLDPEEEYTIGIFYEQALRIIKEIRRKKKIPIFVGGTAFYFKHLKDGFPSTPLVGSKIREYVNNLLELKGKSHLLNELKNVDPVRFNMLNKNDIYRIKRSLEVYYQTGIPISQFKKKQDSKFKNILIIGLKRSFDDLKTRISIRINEMFNDGLLSEIRGLFSKGYNENTPAFKGIGYNEFLLWKSRPFYSLNDIISLINKNSVLYAKRQMTFFAKISDVLWLHPEDDLVDILNLIFKVDKEI